MKYLKTIGSVVTTLIVAANTAAAAPSGRPAFALLRVATDTPKHYAETVRNTVPTVAAKRAHVLGAGFCRVTAGQSTPGEFRVFTLMDSLASALDFLASPPDLPASVTSLRRFQDAAVMIPLKPMSESPPPSGQFATATKTLQVSDPAAFAKVATALESTVRRNGFPGITLQVYAPLGRGETQANVILQVIAPDTLTLANAQQYVSSQPAPLKKIHEQAIRLTQADLGEQIAQCEAVYQKQDR